MKIELIIQEQDDLKKEMMKVVKGLLKNVGRSQIDDVMNEIIMGKLKETGFDERLNKKLEWYLNQNYFNDTYLRDSGLYKMIQEKVDTYLEKKFDDIFVKMVTKKIDEILLERLSKMLSK